VCRNSKKDWGVKGLSYYITSSLYLQSHWSLNENKKLWSSGSGSVINDSASAYEV